MDSVTREDTIYNVLRTDILELRLRPGMLISIKDICETYATGRTPVRDALIRLSKEGLVTFLPQRGTMISKINSDRAENGRFLRTCVEEGVMMECMSLCKPEIVAKLELSMERQETFIKEDDARAFLREDIYFHSIFYKMAGRSFCHQVLNANSGDYRRMRLLSLTCTGVPGDIAKQHREMVDTLIAGDKKRMHSLFRSHVERLINQERTMVDKYPELFEREEPEVRRKPDGLAVDFLAETKLHDDV